MRLYVITPTAIYLHPTMLGISIQPHGYVCGSPVDVPIFTYAPPLNLPHFMGVFGISTPRAQHIGPVRCLGVLYLGSYMDSLSWDSNPAHEDILRQSPSTVLQLLDGPTPLHTLSVYYTRWVELMLRVLSVAHERQITTVFNLVCHTGGYVLLDNLVALSETARALATPDAARPECLADIQMTLRRANMIHRAVLATLDRLQLTQRAPAEHYDGRDSSKARWLAANTSIAANLYPRAAQAAEAPIAAAWPSPTVRESLTPTVPPPVVNPFTAFTLPPTHNNAN